MALEATDRKRKLRRRNQFPLEAAPAVWNVSRHMPDSCVTTLCPTCALCCNGVLFADVRLQTADDPRHLAALGLTLKRNGSVVRFAQPCSCLSGTRCAIYGERPERCRTFECRLLKRTMAGEVSERTALASIRKARHAVENVRRILRELGDTDEAVPLSRRYQRMMRQPIDLSADTRLIDLRGELMLAISELAAVLERDFLK